MHPKSDGNGRTITALLNKFLQEEGFSPTILPTMMLCQTLDKQVEDTLIGMHSFIREVEKSKENTRETSHLA